MDRKTTQSQRPEVKYDFTELINEILGTNTSKKLFEDLATAFLLDPAKHATAAKNAERAREKEAEEKKAETTAKKPWSEARAAAIKPVQAESLTDKHTQVLDLLRDLTATFKEYVKTTDEKLKNIDYQLHAQELQLQDLADFILPDDEEDDEVSEDSENEESCNCELDDCNGCSAGAPEDEPMVRLGFRNGICVCIPARMLDAIFCPGVEDHSEVQVIKDNEEVDTINGAGLVMTAAE